MPAPASFREYSPVPAWLDPVMLGRLRSLGWVVCEIVDRVPAYAVATCAQFPEFSVEIHHSRDSVTGLRYHSFVPLRCGRGVNFLTPEKMHRDVLRRTGARQYVQQN